MDQKSTQWLMIGIFIIGFLLSRIYIYTHAPYQGNREDDALYVPGYSDVQYDYRRYASMWHQGHAPYFKHAYEYFPATIPLLYAPLIVQLAGVGDYYQNYRYMTLIFDVLLFGVILITMLNLKTSIRNQIISLTFFLIIPAVLSNYWLEGIDVAFITSIIIAISTLILINSKLILQRVFVWLFLWISTSLKLISTPLIPLFAATAPQLSRWRKEILIAAITALIVWGIPLAIFRTSLSVPFVLLNQRHLKYASTPSVIVETINSFTKSETYVNQPPDFYWSGPVSQSIGAISTIVYPLAIIFIGLYGAKHVFNIKSSDSKFWWLVHITLTLILATFLTGKIFSQPFHIWYVPILTLLLFKPTKKVFSIVALAIWLILLDTTTLWNPEFLPD